MIRSHWRQLLVAAVGLLAIAALIGLSAGRETPLTVRQHLEETGVVFVDRPTLEEVDIETVAASDLARRQATVGIPAEARATAYLVRYHDPSPEPGPARSAWLVHFSGTAVPVAVGGRLVDGKPVDGEVHVLENIVVILEADGRFIKAVGIPNEAWEDAGEIDPFQLSHR